jgi:hypothetical protein
LLWMDRDIADLLDSVELKNIYHNQ